MNTKEENDLLVDIGNTRLKWGMANGLDIISGEAVLNSEVSNEAFIRRWQELVRPNQIAIANVASNQLADMVSNAARELWPEIKISLATSLAESFGVKNAYKSPESLGVDRWLGMIAAYHRYQTALCIVGCGTAVTVDIVNAAGQHLGGLICPGLRLMKTSLVQNTDKLILSEEAIYPKGLSDCTGAAIHKGTLMAVCGLIEQTLKNQGGHFKLILTGGDAEIIATCLTTPAIIEPNLVLSGLALSLTMS